MAEQEWFAELGDDTGVWIMNLVILFATLASRRKLRRIVRISNLLVILLLLSLSCCLKAQQYSVSLDFKDPLHATVQATFTIPDGKLFTHRHAGGYEWSDYIKNFLASREGGSVIPLEANGPGQWTLKTQKDEKVHLAYDVDLSFTEKIREGAQRSGQFFGNSLYVVNRTLFVMSDATGPRDVQFVVPSGFKIATPWKVAAPFKYRAQDNSELVDNVTVFGDFPSFQITEEPFHLSMVLPGGGLATQSLIQPVLQSVLHEYIGIFPKTPDFHILMAFFLVAWRSMAKPTEIRVP
jgi:predicted metalloprotease with PDZ domain